MTPQAYAFASPFGVRVEHYDTSGRTYYWPAPPWYTNPADVPGATDYFATRSPHTDEINEDHMFWLRNKS